VDADSLQELFAEFGAVSVRRIRWCRRVRRRFGRRDMKSAIAKRSIVVGGHKTSVSLEDAFWSTLKHIARERRETLGALVAMIDSTRGHGNLSSAIRLFLLGHFRPDPNADRQREIEAQQSRVAA
jgi:predicted DNA-binding ribbon-helix-helix protein